MLVNCADLIAQHFQEVAPATGLLFRFENPVEFVGLEPQVLETAADIHFDHVIICDAKFQAAFRAVHEMKLLQLPFPGGDHRLLLGAGGGQPALT